MTSTAALPHLIVGLTGGIGSGKSTVARLFEQAGARIIDTDHISHQLTQSGGAAIAAIRHDFGASFIDSSGALDRNKMREVVFGDAAAKKRLEGILHPLIREQARQLAELPTNAPYTLLIVPLLIESNNYQWLHRIVVVDCSELTQIARTMQRSGLNEPAVRTIMATQASRAQRLRQADDIIYNDGLAEQLTEQVTRLHLNYLALAAGSD